MNKQSRTKTRVCPLARQPTYNLLYVTPVSHPPGLVVKTPQSHGKAAWWLCVIMADESTMDQRYVTRCWAEELTQVNGQDQLVKLVDYCYIQTWRVV